MKRDGMKGDMKDKMKEKGKSDPMMNKGKKGLKNVSKKGYTYNKKG